MFYSYSFIIILFIRMKMRRVNHNLMTTLSQAYRYILGKLFKASVVIRYTTRAYKCYLHNYLFYIRC